MASGEDPKVREQGTYSDSEVGPQADSATWDKKTPMGGDGYRDTQGRAGEDAIYVIDESDKQATPPGMLSRNRLREHGGVGKEAEAENSNRRMIVLAVVLAIGVLGLGVAAVVSSRVELSQMDQAAAAAAAAKPDAPEDVQGVRVRKGMKHNPMEPAKKPGTTIADENPMPLNAVPDGGRPADAPPTEGAEGAEPTEGAKPTEGTEPATETPEGAAPPP